MPLLLLLNVLTLCGPFIAARRTLNAARWQWGLLGLTTIYWFCQLVLSGLATALLFGKFSSPTYAITAVLMSALVALAARRWLPNPTEQFQPPPRPALSRWELYPLLFIAALTLLWNLFALDILPVRIWETLNYRAVTVGMWMQGEPLRGFETSSIGAYTFPGNTELLQLWWCIHPHHDRWIEMPQWLAALALADFIGMLALDMKIPPAGRCWSAALTLLIPVISIQAATEQDDLTTAAAFTCGLIFLRRWIYDSPQRAQNALAAGASLGFALGSKVVLIPFLVPVAIWILFSWRKIFRTFPAFVLPFIALGFYFYADNLIRFGNPLYPFPVKLFGLTLFAPDLARGMPENVPGLGNLLTHLRHAPAEWFESHANVPAYSEASGFGPLWSALLLPALCVLIIERLLPSRSEAPLPSPLEGEVRQSASETGVRRAFFPLALTVAFGELLMWSNTTWTPFDLRYSMHIPALAAAPAALCLCRTRQPWRAIVCAVAIVLGAWTAGNTIANNWNSPISRIMELRRLPFEQRTYANLNTMPEAKLFATLEADGPRAESKSVALLTQLSALRSAAFGPLFQRRVWNPDPLKMQGPAAAGRWAREVEARQIDTVLVMNAAEWQFGFSKEAQADLANPSRWTLIFTQSTPAMQMLAYRKVPGKTDR